MAKICYTCVHYIYSTKYCNEHGQDREHDNVCKDWGMSIEDELEMLREENKKLQQMQWIPVNEKQPELFVKCLIFYAIDEFRIADSTFGYFDGNKFQFRIKISHENPVITHWMPLPEPPKDGDNNG